MMWIKQQSKNHPGNYGRQFIKSINEVNTATDLFNNIAFHGYQHLIDPDTTLCEKFLWLVVHMTTMSFLLSILVLSWEDFASRYIAINIHNPLYPIENVPFPAVTVCTSNRISYSAALEYAEKLILKDPENRSIDYFMQNIMEFAKMYSNSETYVDYERLEEFQTFLDTYDLRENDTFYNTRRKIEQLSPKCEDIILNCKLAGQEIDCFDAKAFKPTFTMYGPCCTFNTKHAYRERTLRYRFLNPDLGLTVTLNASDADDFATILNIAGYVVMIHDPNIFPQISSGNSHQVFPSHGLQSYVSISTLIVDTDEQLRGMIPTRRKCYFDDEAPDHNLLLNNVYSFANCITRCRMRSFIALCNCLPFYLPIELIANADGIVYCTLQHLACLIRYNFKWNNVLTERVAVPGMEQEKEEALFCPNCMPSCVDQQNELSLRSLQIKSNLRTAEQAKHNLSQSIVKSNISILNVHFDGAVAKYYRRTIGNNWFQAFYTVGNVTSIFLGFSMVAIFEIGFILSRKIVASARAFIQRNSSRGKQNRKTRNFVEDENKLYICP